MGEDASAGGSERSEPAAAGAAWPALRNVPDRQRRTPEYDISSISSAELAAVLDALRSAL